jgi:hypothetical protein
MEWVLDTSSAAAAACTTPVFDTPTLHRQNVLNITAADVDGDGLLDLATVGPLRALSFNTYFTGVLSLYSGDGTGVVRPSHYSYGAGYDPRSIAAGDFNGDGVDDLVIALGNGNSGVSGNTSQIAKAVVNLSGGNFYYLPESYLTWTGPGADSLLSAVVVADFNADGNPDVALTSANANTVLTALGDGAGNFTDFKIFSSGGVTPAHLVAADFNGDGKPDLAVANSSAGGNNVAILQGDGAGNFGTPTTHAAGDSPTFIASGDFNADHKIDLAVMVNGGAQNIAILIGDGGGGFAAPSYVASGGTTPGNLVAVDFNGDGKIDIGVANKQEGNVAILLGDGAGSFNFSTAVVTGSASPTFIIAPDLNDDGRPELVVVHRGMGDSDVFSVMINDCAPTRARLSFNPRSYSTHEGANAVTLTVIRSGSLAGTVTADYATFDESAVSLSDYKATSGTLIFADGETSKTITVEIADDTLGESGEMFRVQLRNPTGSAILLEGGSAEVNISANDQTPVFSVNDASVTEGEGRATLTVTRTHDLSGVAVLDYRTQDADDFTVGCSDATGNGGSAYARCDFATTFGRLDFAVGETQKTFTIPIIDDGHDEGAETFRVFFFNPSIRDAPTYTKTITIQDNDGAGTANPIFTTPFFVRQHYLDFLSREPEAGEPWSAVLNNCSDVNNDPSCDRLTVSQSFFRSPESQLKAFYVFRLYKMVFKDLPSYRWMVEDMSLMAGATEAEVYARKALLASAFARRLESQSYLSYVPNTTYVSRLLGKYQLKQITTPDPAHPDGTAKVTLTQSALVNGLKSNTLTRAMVLRAVADSDEVMAREFNNAFVAMQYYGYLHRTPDAAGYNAWLEVLRRGDTRTMVNGFMNSAEYRLRFGRL